MSHRKQRARIMARQQYRILNPPPPKAEPVQRLLELQKDPDTGDSVMVLPPDLMLQLDWREGDRLRWKRVRGGVWELVNRTLLARQRRTMAGKRVANIDIKALINEGRA